LTEALVKCLCVQINLKELGRRPEFLEGGVEKNIREGKLIKASEFSGFEKNESMGIFFEQLSKLL
jgi:hypothetical protein